jgi:poly(hydroxyalkanoate) granule-associated protein
MDDAAGMNAGEKQQGASRASRVLRDTLLAGLGVVGYAGEGAAKLVDALVEKGRELEPRVSKGVDEMGQGLKDFAGKVGRGAGQAEAKVDEKVGETLRRMGFPTKSEIDDLARKVDELSARLAEFRAASTAQQAEQGSKIPDE